MASYETTQPKALAVIEGLILLQEPTFGLLADLYKFAHVGLGECGNAHEDWVRELEDTYVALHTRAWIET